MKILSTKIIGVKLIYPKYIKDKRGFFVENYNLKKFKSFFKGTFVQENKSLSKQKNTFRGLHYQIENFAQDKLIGVDKGQIFDYIFDLRKKSKTYNKLLKIKIGEKSRFLIFIPKGCAHGFLTLKKNTIICYKVSNYYNKFYDSGINHKGVIPNLYKKIIISKKDKNLDIFDFKKKYF
jgi:dTDP-4-dehydrorhamnose 3,5-epimerase